jgi:hypothetical protein
LPAVTIISAAAGSTTKNSNVSTANIFLDIISTHPLVIIVFIYRDIYNYRIFKKKLILMLSCYFTDRYKYGEGV